MTRVVILGGGHGGLPLVSKLSKEVGNKIEELWLVDRNDYTCQYNELPILATGYAREEFAKRSIKSVIFGNKINFIQDEILEILPDEQKVILQNRALDYDILVISLGSKSNKQTIHGAESNSITLKSISDAIKINKILMEMVNSQVEHNIVIVGGGPSGLSTAGFISDFIVKLNKMDYIHVLLFDSTNILDAYHSEMRKRSLEILKEKGILVHENSPVESITNSGVITANSMFNSSLTILCNGVVGNVVLSNPPIDLDQNERIVVNEFLQSIKYENIFALGDIAIRDNISISFPQLSQIAVRQANYLSKYISGDYLSHSRKQSGFSSEVHSLIINLGIEKYVGKFNEHITSGNYSDIFEHLEAILEHDDSIYEIIKSLYEERISKIREVFQKEYKNLTT